MSYGDYLRNKYHHAAVKLADAEGVPCVLENSKGKNIRNYEIYGNSVQDGTPTPEAPVEIQSVGNLTTKNLLHYPYYDTTLTVNGVTWTDNGDGSITASGTATDYTSFSLVYKMQGVIQPNKEYVFSLNETNAKNIAVDVILYDKDEKYTRTITTFPFTTAENEELITINIKRSVSGYSVGGTFKPQFELGSTATEYEPYHKYDIPVMVTGKNLIKYPYYWTSRTRSGITFTVNGDGTVTLNGTTTLSGTSVDDFLLVYYSRIESGTYTVSGCPAGGSTRKYRIFLNIKDSSGNPKYISDIGNGVTFTVTDTSTMTVSIRIEAEIGTVNNLVFAPQIELGSTATEYELYKGKSAKHVYLDEPLRKVGDYADYIDFKNQKVVRNAAEATLNGSETWAKTADTSEGVYQGFALSNSAYNIPKGNNLACFSNKFPYLSLSSAAEKNSAYTLRIIIGAEYVPDLELSTFKTWLSTNNVKIVYPLAAPTEESIALPALKTFKGTSIISADTAVLPSNIKVKYVRT